MIDLEHLKENIDIYKKGLSTKGCDIDLVKLLNMNAEKNSLQNKLDDLKNKKNILSKTIGNQASSGKNFDDLKTESESLNVEIDQLQKEFEESKSNLDSLLLQIPNLPDEDVPVGNDESNNKEINRQIFTQTKDGLDHVEIGEKLGLIDFESANKISGTRFVVLKGKLARLQEL